MLLHLNLTLGLAQHHVIAAQTCASLCCVYLFAGHMAYSGARWATQAALSASARKPGVNSNATRHPLLPPHPSVPAPASAPPSPPASTFAPSSAPAPLATDPSGGDARQMPAVELDPKSDKHQRMVNPFRFYPEVCGWMGGEG